MKLQKLTRNFIGRVSLSMVFFLSLILALNSCDDKDENTPPEKAVLTFPDKDAVNIDQNVKLKWDAAIDKDNDKVVYDVYLGTKASPDAKVSNKQTTTEYLTSELKANTKYYWMVITTDPDGEMSKSEIRSFTTLNNSPGVVTLTLPANDANTVSQTPTLTWQAVTDPDGDNIVYDVYCGTEAIPVNKVSSDLAEVSYTCSENLNANTKYYWKVVAKDANGGSGSSAVNYFTTLNNSPHAFNLSLPENNSTNAELNVSLSWEASTDPDQDPVVYDVYFGTESEPVTKVSTGQSEITYTPSSDLNQNTKYYWKVVAKDDKGGEISSAIFNFTTKLIITKPVVTTKNISDSKFNVATSGGNITSNGNATITACGVCWSKNDNLTIDNCLGKTTESISDDFTSSLTGLLANTVYYVRAYATNIKGTSYGEVKEFRTPLETGTVTDASHNTYKTVKIGNQWWMAENLRATNYNNGSAITLVTDNSNWYSGGYFYSWYNNDSSNKEKYGALYTWGVATKDICPTGWHIPTKSEWTELINHLGGDQEAGGKLKETGTDHWTDPNYGATNESGFTAIPGGKRRHDGVFEYKGTQARYWSKSTQSTNGCYLLIRNYQKAAIVTDVNKKHGHSIRCVKD